MVTCPNCSGSNSDRNNFCIYCGLKLNLSSKIHFPRPLFRINQSLLDCVPAKQVISEYLEQILSWRSSVLSYLSAMSVVSPSSSNKTQEMKLTPRAKAVFERFLQDSWNETVTIMADGSPYNICPFPQSISMSTSRQLLESVISVLQWRAGFVDYLSDIWDVMGEPALDIEECRSIERFLYPAITNSTPSCLYCLSAHQTGNQDCLLVAYVQAKWPNSPFNF